MGRGCADMVSPRFPGGRRREAASVSPKRVETYACGCGLHGASFPPMGKPSRPAPLEKLLDGRFDLQVLAGGGELAAPGQAAAVRVFDESVVLFLFQ